MKRIALIAALLGAIGSAALMVRSRGNSPAFLVVLFVIWVIAPFIALAWANVTRTRWTAPTRTTLYWVTIVVVLIALPVYAEVIPRPAGTPRAFMFTLTAPLLWGIIIGAVGAAALMSRAQGNPLPPGSGDTGHT